MKYELLRAYEVEVNGELKNYVCYELTDKYAFLCPFEMTEDEAILFIKNTIVYSVSEQNSNPITSLTLQKAKEASEEV